jgi:hypothetical protein
LAAEYDLNERPGTRPQSHLGEVSWQHCIGRFDRRWPQPLNFARSARGVSARTGPADKESARMTVEQGIREALMIAL